MATINPEGWTPCLDQYGRPRWVSKVTKNAWCGQFPPPLGAPKHPGLMVLPGGLTFSLQRRLSESLYGAVYQAVQGNCPDLKEPPTFLMPVEIEDQTHVAVGRSRRAKIRTKMPLIMLATARLCSVTSLEACMSEIVLPGDGMGKAHAVKFFLHILRGLSCVHSKGLRHHDLSLENVMLDYKGDVAVTIDFGMAIVPPADVVSAHDSAPFGKNRYMAPEILLNEAYDGLKIDIFCVGAMLHMLLNADYAWAAPMRTPLLSRGIYFDPSHGKVPTPRDWRRLEKKDVGPVKELKCGTTGEVFETRKETLPTGNYAEAEPEAEPSSLADDALDSTAAKVQGNYAEAEPSSLADDALDSTAAKVQGNSGDLGSLFPRALAISEAHLGPEAPTAATKDGSGKTAGKNADKGVGQFVSMIDQVGRRDGCLNTTGAWNYGYPSIEEVHRVYNRRQGLNEWCKRASRGKSTTCASSVLGVIAAASYVPGVAATETFGERIGSMVSPQCVGSIVSPECLESIGSAILRWLCHAPWWAHVLIVTLAGMVIFTSMVFSVREMKAGNAKFWAAWRESLRVKQAAAARRQGHPRASR